MIKVCILLYATLISNFSVGITPTLEDMKQLSNCYNDLPGKCLSYSSLLVENFDEDTEVEIELAIKLAVQTFEPRATVKSVRIIFAPDSNRVNITTTFGIINTGQQVVIETNLSRLR